MNYVSIRLNYCHIIQSYGSSIIAIIDYALSQSTLEQVFLKQIRPTGQEDSLKSISTNSIKVPHRCDYINGYLIWLLAGVIPGLHQFYLGDTWRGLKYFFTLNEFVVGWLLDLFEMHVLVQKRVQQYGNAKGCCCLSCLSCCQASTNDRQASANTELQPSLHSSTLTSSLLPPTSEGMNKN